MGNVIVVGDKESVMPFKMFGIEALELQTSDKEKFSDLLKKYSVIFVTEYFAKIFSDIIESVRKSNYPIIVEFPGINGSYNIGRTKIKKIVEHAIGTDILAKK